MSRTPRIERLVAMLAIGASIATSSVMARAGRRPDVTLDDRLQPERPEQRVSEPLEPYTGPRYEPSSYDRPHGYPHPRYGRHYRYRTDYYGVPMRYVRQWEEPESRSPSRSQRPRRSRRSYELWGGE